MTISVASLDRRSPAQLRAFVAAQHVEVERHPESIDQWYATTYATYRRYLIRRVPLEGICRYYQTYDAYGDENDWNLNIQPDPAYAWMLDPGILYALAQTVGSTIDLSTVKVKEGYRVIEAELTPDDGLYDKFTVDGLPIQSGGIWRDQSENEGEGPDDLPVGVYGVFCGDYGHGGRPEIHPFDAFWRRLHTDGGTTRISWDFGAFQDDSNRFNDTWSKAPIDVEFRVPFCVSVPVTLQTTLTTRVRFVLSRSDFCTVVGKNTRDAGASNLTETFTAHTVRLRPGAENRVEITVEDATGVPGRPFRLGFDDVTYTSTSRFGLFSQQAWIAGFIVIRVAIDQDGYAYWNFRGPNSPSAINAPDDPRVIDGPVDVKDVLIARLSTPRRPRGTVQITNVRPVVSLGDAPSIGAEVAVTIEGSGELNRSERVVTVRPRENPLVVDDETGEAVELESFDLFALATAVPVSERAVQQTADIASSIARLAGLEHGGGRLRAGPATVEVDEEVAVDVHTRYAPFRDGEVQGEEHSRLSESLNGVDTGPIEVWCDASHLDGEGRVRRARTGEVKAVREDQRGPEPARVERIEDGYRVVVGQLGSTPTVVNLDVVATDQFGLRSVVSVVAPNYRVVDARAWVEQATGLHLNEQRKRLDELERLARRAPTDRARANAGLVRCLAEVLESLDNEPAVSAFQVAGAVRLAARVEELVAGRPVG
jgi:hypothetical protein